MMLSPDEYAAKAEEALAIADDLKRATDDPTCALAAAQTYATLAQASATVRLLRAQGHRNAA